MSLIRDLALRYMGEGGQSASEDGASLCTSFVCTQNYCVAPFSGNDCLWSGHFCAYNCTNPDFVCSDDVTLYAFCTAPFACPAEVYTCGTSPTSIFVCGAEFGGCPDEVVCTGKYQKCDNGACVNVDRQFDCGNFSCGATAGGLMFSCIGEHTFTCSTGDGSYDCYSEYNCKDMINHSYQCFVSFHCPDTFDCTDVIHACTTFECAFNLNGAFDCKQIFSQGACTGFTCPGF